MNECHFFEIIQNAITSSTLWTAVSAIATLVMAYITYKTLMQNKEQLNDIQKQRLEDTRARIICKLVLWNNTYLIKVENIGKEPAYNVNIHVTGEPITQNLSKTIKKNFDRLSKLDIILPAGEYKCFVLYSSSLFAEGNFYGANEINEYTLREVANWLSKYNDKPIDIRIKYNNKYTLNESFSISKYFIDGSVILPDNLEIIANTMIEMNKNKSY